MNGISPLLARRRRKAISEEINQHLDRVTLLMERLDAMDDASRDMEDDDPAGDPLEVYGEMSSDDGRRLLPVPPIYGRDQSRPPVNYASAMRLVRTATPHFTQENAR